MSWDFGTSGGNKTAYAATVGTSGGNKTVLEGYVGTSGGNKLFYSALTASAAPLSLTATSPSASPIVTGPATVTVTGGVGPFTYAWSIDNPAITITSPSSASTTFSATPPVLDSEVGTATCLITDTATGATATTNGVAVTITRT